MTCGAAVPKWSTKSAGTKKKDVARNATMPETSRLVDTKYANANTLMKTKNSVIRYESWALAVQPRSHQKGLKMAGYWNAPKPWPNANVCRSAIDPKLAGGIEAGEEEERVDVGEKIGGRILEISQRPEDLDEDNGKGSGECG